ncbi:acetaldehyde dehydrogenase (acetylating) [Lysinibacillus endophyticus]|uniref:acetaldehyde dehydrogenase (acetylating) n=1 Tax=Ureibacillus endophyticus TaxID=1978490 RepID=UPI00209E03D1|nr:acetaldehyde dehydrogenase (acetylating) [Lysinibacillus endophyticus]MCP1145927.1 acetaldehyde dehydrogenase (acetylating) [Lysinibacillus endophyticus]
MAKVKVAILGSGNIGTDLMYKILKNDGNMELALVAGIDPKSEGLARAKEKGIATSHYGIDEILEDSEIKIVFDATSAKAHQVNAPKLKEHGKFAVDMTPAAVGPFVVPTVNLNEHLEEMNVNLISCGGQATTPLVYAVNRVVSVHYAEVIATAASVSIGPGTRQNVDEFVRTTASAVQKIGGAKIARAIPVFNPAQPPINMTNSVYAVIKEEFDERAVIQSVESIAKEISKYVPGYRLKGTPIVDYRDTPWGRLPTVVIMNEVVGAGDFFPTYAGNLDIMTASAYQVGDVYAAHVLSVKEGAR